MAKSKLDKLLSLYREGYISRDELMRHSRKILPQRRKAPSAKATASALSPPAPRAPQAGKLEPVPPQAVIELDFPPMDARFFSGQRNRPRRFPVIAMVFVLVSMSGWYYVQNGSINLSLWKTRVATAIAPETPQQTTDKLRQHAEQLMNSPQWDPAEVELFTQHWAKLATEQQKILAQSLWYKKFSLYLALQIAQLGSPALSNNADTKGDLEPLRQLSNRLGNEPVVLQDPITKKGTRIRDELAALNDLVLKKSELKNPAPNNPYLKNPYLKNPSLKNPSLKNQSELENLSSDTQVSDNREVDTPIPTPIITTAAAPALSTLPPTPLNPQELERLLLRYAYYYEGGQIKELMGLFTGAGWSQGEIGHFELQERYQETFAKTTNRKLQIDAVRWSFKGNAAFGTGKLKLTYTNAEGLDTQEQVGNIRLVALKEKDKLVFSHLYHIF